MSAGVLPQKDDVIYVEAKVVYQCGPFDVDQRPCNYVIRFRNGAMMTLSKTDTIMMDAPALDGMVIAQ